MTAGVMPSCGPRSVEHVAALRRRTPVAEGEDDFGALLGVLGDGMTPEPSEDAGGEAEEGIPSAAPEEKQDPPALGLLSIMPPMMLPAAALQRPVPNLEATLPAAETEQSLAQWLAAGGLPELPAQAAAAVPPAAGGTTAPNAEEHPVMPAASQPEVIAGVAGPSAPPENGESTGDANPGTRDEAFATSTEEDWQSEIEHLRPPAAADGTAAGQADVPPALQIISKISDLAARPSGAPPGLSAPQSVRVAGNEDVPRPQLKALRIRLQPEELGEVEVTLRRVGQETKVLIAVTSKAAADQLSRDLSLLEDRLGGLLNPGATQTVSVSLQAQDTAPMAEQAPSASSAFANSEASLQGGREPGRDGRPAPDRQRNPSPMARNERHEEDRRAGTPAPGIRVV